MRNRKRLYEYAEEITIIFIQGDKTWREQIDATLKEAAQVHSQGSVNRIIRTLGLDKKGWAEETL